MPNDVMRTQYKELTQDNKAEILVIKTEALYLYNTIVRLGSSRELSIAKTKLEEVVMWATKHITA